jgi:hypothetical protein
MAMLESIPAVRRIDTDRDDLFAVDVVGHVSSADVENLYGLLEAAYALHPKIDVLVRLIDHDGVDWAEVDENTVRDGKAHARDHVRRCASVGEPDWTGELGGWFTSAEPVELRHFSADDEADAWAWLGAKAVDSPV